MAGAEENTTTDPINVEDRQAVLDAYDAEFDRPEIDPTWTGDRATCAAGTTSAAYRASVLSRVNWFRAMGGVPASLVENDDMTKAAQQTALMSSVSGAISHNPDDSFDCNTQTAVAASANSNLYLGREGTNAINGFMQDPGTNNASVGHRNWILHPTLTEVGIGNVPSGDQAGQQWASSALNVVQAPEIVFGPQPTLREEEGFVAWPVAGYTPADVVFDRWSFSLRDADFSEATVAASSNGATIETAIEFASTETNAAPFPIVVWTMPTFDPANEFDTTVTVTVNNVLLNGSYQDFSYDSTIIGEQALTAQATAHNKFVAQAFNDLIGRAPSLTELNGSSAWIEDLYIDLDGESLDSLRESIIDTYEAL